MQKTCKIHLLPGSRYEKVCKLMVHFHWLRSPRRRANILLHSSSSRKIAMFVNIGKREK